MGWQDREYNRDESGGIPPVRFAFPPLSQLTMIIVGVNLIIFLLRISPELAGTTAMWGALTFVGETKWQVWRWVTYQYLHGDAGHVFFNMLAVYFFLPSLEMRWGKPKAFVFYTLGGIFAGFGFLLLSQISGRYGASLVGASGSVFAIMGAVALLYPARQLILLVFPVPIRVAVGLFAVLFLLASVGDRNLSDAAHLFGLIFGFFAPLLAGPWLSRKRRQLSDWKKERDYHMELSEQREIDRILAKVADQGMNSLTSGEKKSLARATANQNARDAKRARSR